MRTILAAVAAIIAGLAAFTNRWVRKGGRWVLAYLTTLGAAPAIPAVEPTLTAELDDVAPIRRVAGILAQGHRPQAKDLVGLRDDHLAWLRECSRLELCTVMASGDAAIRGHVLDRQAIRNVPRADTETVGALRRNREARGQRGIDGAVRRRRREEVEKMVRELEEGGRGAAWELAI